ncbi:MAG TPA: hypothetical protein VF606_07335 [Geminicoccaceae bacterium]
MRHALPPRLAKQRAALRRGLAPHRPRPPVWSRDPQNPRRTRVSDIVLGVLAATLLGAVALAACLAITGRTLAP